MRSAIFITFLFLCPNYALAQITDCEILQNAYHVEKPENASSLSPKTTFGCTVAELEMFRINHNAVANAVPVTNVADLEGTWLGDDVYLQIQGIALPGQEVLSFTSTEDNTVFVRQSWIKASAPTGLNDTWTPDGHYDGWIAQGTLEQQHGSAQFSDYDYDRTFQYSGAQFEYERAEDLYVKQRLNRFDQTVEFSLYGDTLVVKSYTLSLARRNPINAIATFTRVSPTAPDTAIAMIAAMQLSQRLNFDCFAHQISDGKGPLIDAIAPFTIDEIGSFVHDLLKSTLTREVMLSQIFDLDDGPEKDAMQAQIQSDIAAISQRPELQVIADNVVRADPAICPDLR